MRSWLKALLAGPRPGSAHAPPPGAQPASAAAPAPAPAPGGTARVPPISAPPPLVGVGTGAIELSVHVTEDGVGNVLLSVVPPEAGASPSLDVCIMLDTSGSMGDAANPNGAEEVKLFSKLDLAKRGSEVVARALGPTDFLTVLGYSSGVVEVLPRTAMTPQGVELALRALNVLQADGRTALWDGLHAGLHALEIAGPAFAASSPAPSPAPVAADIDNAGVSAGCVAAPEPGPGQGAVAAAKGARGALLPVGILLTDGQPSPSPPQGEVQALREYMAARDADGKPPRRRSIAKLVTVGFGYDVNSKLLVELANTHGPGSDDFCFIPDGTMLLTSFVNMMANLQSYCAGNTRLRLTPPPAPASAGASPSPGLASLAPGTGEAPLRPTPDGDSLEIPVGFVQYGQARQVVLRDNAAAAGTGPGDGLRGWRVEALYEPLAGQGAGGGAAAVLAGPPSLDVPMVTQQLHRALAIHAITTAARVASVDPQGAQKAVKDAALAAMALQGGPMLAHLQPHPVLEDLTGEVAEAVSSSATFGKWGQHYLRSLLCAHRAQACNNFKDPGVLAYGGAHTRARRDVLNHMCDTLPVPVPSINHHRFQGNVAMGTPLVSGRLFRHHFNNAAGGCFGAGGLVAMADGSTKAVERLRKGDAVATSGGCGSARVRCVVTYPGAHLVRLPGSGLSITAWHPVRPAGAGSAWRFPADLLLAAGAQAGSDGGAGGAAAAVASPAAALPAQQQGAGQEEAQRGGGGRVYNLVLDGGHVVVVDGVEAVTLGHGMEDDDVVRHPYFGTERVVRELQALPGWQRGWVDLQGGLVRDTATSLVSGLGPAEAPYGAAPAVAAAGRACGARPAALVAGGPPAMAPTVVLGSCA